MADAHGSDVERMSDFEALMWQLEKSPALSNTFANVTILDLPPLRETLVAKMSAAIAKVPKLHQRPVAPAGRLANPEWVDDPEFDIDHHIRWANLGGDASDRELYDFVTTLATQPFDRERPLWDFTLVEGLSSNRAAMVQRMHHTITDGEGGIRLSAAFIDLERSPEGDTLAGEPDTGQPTQDTHSSAHGEEADALAGTAVLDTARALADSVRTRGGQVIDAIGSAASMVLRPGDAAELARSAGRQVQVISKCSPIWTERSLSRWYGTTTLELAEVKQAAHLLGGSVNDFFVTGATAAAGEYHRRAGHPVKELRLSMPVSIRSDVPKEDRSDPMAGGNAFSPTQTLVPTGELDAAERFSQLHDRLLATRSERVVGALDGAAAVVNLLPTAALLATGERATAGIDFVCSNVRAAPFDLYIAGALMEANYPVGPLAGTAFNLTTMSYRGYLFIGLHVDSGAITEPQVLLDGIEAAYQDLFEAARRRA
ncbi:MAG: DUF1298 domain-containing protein [Actinomycetia bacterium]|nr:DUF1298 domain-containing protein [Actinomycetes bacterium]